MDNIYIKEKIIKSFRQLEEIFSDDAIIFTIDIVSKEMATTLKNGGKVLFCGTGPSSIVAQNMADSLSGKILDDRPPLHAAALHSSPTFLSGISAEYGFDEAFARMALAMGSPGDMLLAICGSKAPTSVLNALSMANNMGMKTIGMSPSGSGIESRCGEHIEAGSEDPQRCQESHLLIGNIICEIVESIAYKKSV